MHRWAHVIVVAASLMGCSFDWDPYDPRLSNTSGAGTPVGGAGGSPAGPGGGSVGGAPGGGGAGATGGTPATGGTGGTGGSPGGAGGMGGAPGAGGAGGAGGGPVSPVCNAMVPPMLDNGVTVSGSTNSAPTQLDAGCAGTTGGERVYYIDVPAGANVVLTNDLPGTTYDTILYVRTVCEDPGTELACDDPAVGDTIMFTAPTAGVYFVIVDSHTPTNEGDFELLVTW